MERNRDSHKRDKSCRLILVRQRASLEIQGMKKRHSSALIIDMGLILSMLSLSRYFDLDANMQVSDRASYNNHSFTIKHDSQCRSRLSIQPRYQSL